MSSSVMVWWLSIPQLLWVNSNVQLTYSLDIQWVPQAQYFPNEIIIHIYSSSLFLASLSTMLPNLNTSEYSFLSSSLLHPFIWPLSLMNFPILFSAELHIHTIFCCFCNSLLTLWLQLLLLVILLSLQNDLSKTRPSSCYFLMLA